MRFNIKNRSKQTVLPLKIQLSRGKGWDPINQFNSTISLCRFQTRTMISNLVCCGIYFVFSEGRWEVIVAFVDIGLIVNHHFLNFLFIMIASIGFAHVGIDLFFQNTIQGFPPLFLEELGLLTFVLLVTFVCYLTDAFCVHLLTND